VCKSTGWTRVLSLKRFATCKDIFTDVFGVVCLLVVLALSEKSGWWR